MQQTKTSALHSRMMLTSDRRPVPRWDAALICVLRITCTTCITFPVRAHAEGRRSVLLIRNILDTIGNHRQRSAALPLSYLPATQAGPPSSSSSSLRKANRVAICIRRKSHINHRDSFVAVVVSGNTHAIGEGPLASGKPLRKSPFRLLALAIVTIPFCIPTAIGV